MDNIKVINENAHTKIMREMASYLDSCKTAKINCNCTCVLEHDPTEKDEFKKFKFLYQCGSNENYNKVVENITNDMLKNVSNIKVETYDVQK